MSESYPDWWHTINEIIVDHEGRLTTLEQDRETVYLYGAGTPWPDVAKLQIEELQQAVAAQTATINRLVDRLEYLETFTHRYINQAEGDGR